MGVEGAGGALGGVAPDVLEQLRLREHARGVRGEGVQKRELLRRELDLTAGETHLAREGVDREIADPQRAAAGADVRAAQHRADARQELSIRERLPYGIKSADPVWADLALTGLALGVFEQKEPADAPGDVRLRHHRDALHERHVRPP